MGSLNVEKEKLKIIKWVTELKDDSDIERLKMLRESPKTKRKDWWDEITDEEKLAINKGLEDMKLGKVKPHNEAKKIYVRWL